MKIHLNKMMKSALLCAVFGLVFTACQKRFDEVNRDLNNSTETATSFLLTNAQKSMMDFTWDEWFNGRRGNQLAQYWASNQYSAESRYALRVNITNSYWSLFYTRSLQDLEEIIRLNTNTPEATKGFGMPENQIAIAKTLQAWLYQNMTDTWGPIPFSEALQGADFPFPSYDAQEDIYMGLLEMLDEALANFDDTDMSVQGDQIYGGDISKWKKFAASMKMRVALRMADVKPAEANTAMAEAISAGLMTSNADNAEFMYMNGAPNNNPLAEDFKTRNDFAASNTMVDELNRLNDPRVGFYYEPTAASVLAGNPEYVGEVYGLKEADAALTLDADISQRNAQVLAETAPGIYLDYAQVEFMLAEAAERGVAGAGSAAAHYEEGIRASMMYWDVDNTLSSTDIDNYLAQPEVEYTSLITGGQTWREVIGRQKWIALYMQGVQGWTEWRRLDFDILQNPAGGNLDGLGIPNRMIYPIDEQTLNGEQYAAGVALLGGPDELNTKLWWDVN
jgi:hypothetical protein